MIWDLATWPHSAPRMSWFPGLEVSDPDGVDEGGVHNEMKDQTPPKVSCQLLWEA